MNGLRGIAALAILTTHTWDYGSPRARTEVAPIRSDVGFLNPVFLLFGLAVVLFFTLSGFLLYRRFAAAILGEVKRPSVREYARARILRIVPAYWLILAVVGLIFSAALVRTSSETMEVGNLATHPSALVADFAFAQNYSPSTTVTGIGSTWTLVIEAIFYITLPLLAMPLLAVATRVRSARVRLGLALTAPLVLLMLGLASKEAARISPRLFGNGWDGDWASVFQRSFLFHADLFAAGMTAAVLSVLIERGTLRIGRITRAGGLFGAATILIVVPIAERHGAYPEILYEATMSVCFALVLLGLATAAGRHSLLVGFFQWRPLALVGIVSYSLFLWHEPVARWLSVHGATQPGTAGLAANIALVAAVSLALATLSYRFVERPFMALRKPRRTAPASLEAAQPAAPVPDAAPLLGEAYPAVAVADPIAGTQGTSTG